MVAAPFRIAHADVRPRGPASEVGQHTRQILEAAGLGPEEIEALEHRVSSVCRSEFVRPGRERP